ncbi:MAG TPA: putative baseplate assembly protein [Nitrospiraceae bacterium]|nr:putative baseplate assembly protein [Nitrospiraceae bacterium]
MSERTEAGLSTCGCCEGLAQAAPIEVTNRPGLSAIGYRVGTHGSFKASMLARLSTAGSSVLQSLRTRRDDDFSIGLIDAWATVLDILTFYQERLANESYLLTATERRSLLEQARLIGYEPRPGVAASTYLAFTVEDTGVALLPGAPPPPTPSGPREVLVPKGTKVQSVPGPGETAQMYETIEDLSAHADWNSLQPRLTQPHPVRTDLEQVTVPGLAPFVKAGDIVLIVAGSDPADEKVKQVLRVTSDPKNHTTTFDVAMTPTPVPWIRPVLSYSAFIRTTPTLDNDFVKRGLISGRRWNQRLLLSMARTYRWSRVVLQARINLPPLKPLTTEPGIFGFRERAALFGHNAPKHASLPADQTKTGAVYAENWEGRTLQQEQPSSGEAYIYLDRTYPGIVKGGWVVLVSANAGPHVYQVHETAELTRADFALTAKVTRIRVGSSEHLEKFTLRDTTVFVVSERLDLAPIPIPDVVEGNEVTLNGAYLGLEAGRWVAVTGERQDLSGVQASEVHRLAEVTLEAGLTTLTFQSALAHPYVRASVRISGNVAAATHGESRSELLGSGDGRVPFQQFALRQPPLTYISAPTPTGGQSTLEVRVNDQLWEEVATLYNHGPTEHIYVTRRDDDGKTTIQFGDGVTGARLPTGQQNVRTAYRQGIGAAGLVKASQLSLLMAQPAGVRAVTNPLDATGAADPESLIDIRRNAALTLRTLDRIVSLQDYEDFAAAFSGVSKALATSTWTGRRRGVLLTVAGTEGAVIEESSPVYANLVRAIQEAGDPLVPVQVASYRPAFFKVGAKITVAYGSSAEIVLIGVQDRLREAFSFDARAFGQPVALSEVMSVMHLVPGVQAVQLTQLYRVDDPSAPSLQTELPAMLPQSGSGAGSLGAELLTLDASPLVEIGVAS